MPGRILDFVSRNKPSAQHAKNIIKSSLHNAVAKGASSTISLHPSSSDKLDRETMDLLKRHSISLSAKPESTRKGSQASGSTASLDAGRVAKLDMVVESPPLLSFNRPAESSGALFSGQLRLRVLEASAVFETIELRLLCSVTYKRPVDKHCPNCARSEQELRKWNFAPELLTLARGEHKFPMSYLFEGEMPATTHANHLGLLDYHFSAVAKTAEGDIITLAEKVELGRAILPGNDKQSIRVFPPTNITANVTLNPTVHAIGAIPVSLRLVGLSNKQKDNAVLRWRLRRLNWRIEEHMKLVSPACSKHQSKVSEGKDGILHEEIRNVGEHEIHHHKNPWKADYVAGELDCEFNASINPAKKPVCDVASDIYGLSVSHVLILEMVVAEEWVPSRRPQQATPTGAARILRAQFPLTLTLRAGMGVAWDEETPPVYQDVPASPPTYKSKTEVEDFDISELDDNIDQLHLGEPHERAHSSVASSSSTVLPTPSQSRRAFSEDDLLSEPHFPLTARIPEETEPEVDVQVEGGTE
jgi:hypothetical protein